MDTFDIWDTDMDVDLDALDADVTIGKKVANATDIAPNKEKDDLEWDNEENLDKSTQWRKIISTIEANIASKYGTARDKWEYKKDKALTNYRAVKGTNTPEEKSLVSQLRNLKQDYLDLKSNEEDDITELNFLKGRASGFIDEENYMKFNNNPNEVKKELETGKYPYKPTEQIFK